MLAFQSRRIASRKLRFLGGVRGLVSATDTSLVKTAVYDDHVALGGKMVEFAGYWLPVQYPAGVKSECLQTRNSASVFDVSHMGQLLIHGKDAAKFVELLTVADIQSLKMGGSQLSLITNEEGGIVDDTVVTKHDKFIGMVVNGACKEKDLKHMQQVLDKNPMDVRIEHLNSRSLFAVQGPNAATALSSMVESVDLSSMSFMDQRHASIKGMDCTLTRCGYTGEDGFEVSVENSDASKVLQSILDHPDVQPAGLGARDTLRIESGLCLYGSDINENTSPATAGLSWTISKRRRLEGGFIGSDHILKELNSRSNGMKRVGLIIDGPPARSHVEIFAQPNGGEPIGEITSGTFSPTLGKPIGIAMIQKSYGKVGKTLYAQIRKNRIPARVSKMPFVPANYYYTTK